MQCDAPLAGPASGLRARFGVAELGGWALGAYGSLSRGYDPGYLLRESSKGAEGYYLSAVDEIGEPPGVWTGRAGAALGLAAGEEVEPDVMEAAYAKLLNPRDPAFADPAVPPGDKARLGAGPRQYKSAGEVYADLMAREPDASPERAEQFADRERLRVSSWEDESLAGSVGDAGICEGAGSGELLDGPIVL
jgi:hypothetical protein